MTTKKQKITTRLQVLVTEDQREKLRLISFYSGKTLGELMRMAIDNFDPKSFKGEAK